LPALLGRIARAMGRADKRMVGPVFELRREFPGGVRYELRLGREQVCERVVVGEEEVEEPDYERVPRRTSGASGSSGAAPRRCWARAVRIGRTRRTNARRPELTGS
jgi:hypothetical protein